MARAKKTEVENQETQSPYVNEAAQAYFEKTFPTKYKVSVSTTLWKRKNVRNGRTSYFQLSAKTAPPVSEEYVFDAICKGGKDGADIVNGPDAQNYKAEKEQFLNQVNQAYANQ